MVILLNGSPHENGTTKRALEEVAKALNEKGILTEIINVAKENVAGCKGCGACQKIGKCIVNDAVNEVADKIAESEGLVIGTPVYYASLNGSLVSFLDRLFYSNGKRFAYKPASGVAVARRAGTTTALDEINRYFSINNMPIVSSQYWNMVFGANSSDAEKDEEGLQTMRVLGKNMAWLIKCIAEGKKNGIVYPETEVKKRTNFIKKD